MATVAVARHAPRGRLAVVGLGPGAADLLTPRAVAELRRAAVVVGLDQYLDQVRDVLRPGTRVLSSGLGAEEERARAAVAEAAAGRAVALIGSGDAGVYAMASPALEYADERHRRGRRARGDRRARRRRAARRAARPRPRLCQPVRPAHPVGGHRAAGAGGGRGRLRDAFYNPRSRARDWQLAKALGILAAHRPPDTPVGVVRNASRPGERVHLATLATLDPADRRHVQRRGRRQQRHAAGRRPDGHPARLPVAIVTIDAARGAARACSPARRMPSGRSAAA